MPDGIAPGCSHWLKAVCRVRKWFAAGLLTKFSPGALIAIASII